MSFVSNATVQKFLHAFVCLHKDRESKYRKQVRYLRERFQVYAKGRPDLKVKKLLFSGSLAKRTHTANLDDIDITAFVDVGEIAEGDLRGVDHRALMDTVRDTLVAVYGDTKSSDDFEVRSTAVAIHFHGTGLDVDVVPVLIDHDSDWDEGWVLRGDGPCLRTCIRRHLDFVSQVHAAHPGYREFVRLLKWWRDAQGAKVRSFVLELLAAHLCRSGVLEPNQPLDAFERFIDWLLQTELDVDIWFDDWFADPGTVRERPFLMDPVNPDNNAADKLQGIWGPSQRVLDLVDCADRTAAALA